MSNDWLNSAFQWFPADEVSCKYCHQPYALPSDARACEARHEVKMAEWEEKAKLVRIKQVLMYTHTSCPVPFLWDVADHAEMVLALWELFYFLEEKGVYAELSDEGLEAHRSNVASLTELETLLAEERIPAALWNEANHKVVNFLPKAKEALAQLTVDAMMYKLIRDDHNEQALVKLLTDRKENPDETWLLLEVRTATGTEPARPAEVVKPKLMLVTADGMEITVDGPTLRN